MENLVDVIMPCYNEEKDAANAVKSALNNKSVRKVIVVDDASSDKSIPILLNLRNQYPNKIEIMAMPSNKGIAYCRNIAIAISSAPYLFFLDADDIVLSNSIDVALQKMFRLSLNASRINVSFANLDTKYMRMPNLKSTLNNVMDSIINGILIKRNLFMSTGGFPMNPELREYGGEDNVVVNALRRVLDIPIVYSSIYVYNCENSKNMNRILDHILFDKSNDVPQEVINLSLSLTKSIEENLISLGYLLNKER